MNFDFGWGGHHDHMHDHIRSMFQTDRHHRAHADDDKNANDDNQHGHHRRRHHHHHHNHDDDQNNHHRRHHHNNNHRRADPDNKYAIFFPEGEGYLLVDSLFHGAQGSVMIVRSVLDSKLYVRKISHPELQNDNKSQGEAMLTPRHSNIPQIMFAETNPKQIPRHARQCFSSVTITQLCNGGDFYAAVQDTLHESDFLGQKKHWLPEAHVWHILYEMLRVLHDVHTTAPYTAHSDVKGDNWFVHWEHDAKHKTFFPKIFLGDFGFALQFPTLSGVKGVLHKNPWSINLTDGWVQRLDRSDRAHLFRWYQMVRSDIDGVIRIILSLIDDNKKKRPSGLEELLNKSKRDDKSKLHGRYSQELLTTLSRLEQTIAFRDQHSSPKELLKELQYHLEKIKKYTKYARERYDSTPQSFDVNIFRRTLTETGRPVKWKHRQDLAIKNVRTKDMADLEIRRPKLTHDLELRSWQCRIAELDVRQHHKVLRYHNFPQS